MPYLRSLMSSTRDESRSLKLDRQRGGVGLATRGDGETTIEKGGASPRHQWGLLILLLGQVAVLLKILA